MDIPPGIAGRAAVLFFLVSTFFLVVSQASAGQKSAELVQKRCQGCHSLSRTCGELGADQESWRQTITNMADYAPAITKKDQKALIKCLAKQKKDVVELCRQ